MRAHECGLTSLVSFRFGERSLQPQSLNGLICIATSVTSAGMLNQEVLLALYS